MQYIVIHNNQYINIGQIEHMEQYIISLNGDLWRTLLAFFIHF